jgi:hypothetical protein
MIDQLQQDIGDDDRMMTKANSDVELGKLQT